MTPDGREVKRFGASCDPAGERGGLGEATGRGDRESPSPDSHYTGNGTDGRADMEASGGWELTKHPAKNEKGILTKVDDLIRDTERNPFSGIGKPEPLKGDLAGWWSRRITGEHRFVYRVVGNGDDRSLQILSCRYHY